MQLTFLSSLQALGLVVFRNVPNMQGVVGILACLFGAYLFATSKKKKPAGGGGVSPPAVCKNGGGGGGVGDGDDNDGDDALPEQQGLLQSKGVGEDDIHMDELHGGDTDPAAV
jgi:hypothetical protein